MAKLFSGQHIAAKKHSSLLYFHHWGWWVLAAASRLGLFALLILLVWVGALEDRGIADMISYCVCPEDYFLLVLSWFTGGEAHSMGGEILGVVVFADTLVADYLLNVVLKVRRRQRDRKRATE